MKSLKVILAVSILLVSLFMVTGCQAVDRLNEAVDINNKAEVIYTVANGATTTSIADDLESIGLIQNSGTFKLLAKENGSEGMMQAGEYSLSKSMSSEDIMLKMVAGDVIEDTVFFTIPEGYEVHEIATLLETEGLINKEEFYRVLQEETFDYKFLEGVSREYNLEGYLFPDTYEIESGASEYDIVVKMLDRFDEKFKDEYYDRALELGMTIDEVVTMATIIEREAMKDEEREIISSVFYNRIKDGYLLQSCATVQYILGERKTVLSIPDTQIDSPYNTYMYTGLPPAPIASPGEASIIAALYPADTNYYYFVTKETNDGSHYFNETLSGHNSDAAKSGL